MSESIEIPGSGSLETLPALEHLDLVAEPVAHALTALKATNPAVASFARVSEVDPELADTEVLTQAFGMDLALSSNCILVAGKRAGEERIAACVVRATTNADVNHVVKKLLDVRKASFWPQERALGDGIRRDHSDWHPRGLATVDRFALRTGMVLHRLGAAPLKALRSRRAPCCASRRRNRGGPGGLVDFGEPDADFAQCGFRRI